MGVNFLELRQIVPESLPVENQILHCQQFRRRHPDLMFDFLLAVAYAKTPHPFLVAGFCYYSRRRPTLPHSYPCSTIGPEGLNFRVRDGNGCDPLGIATEKSMRLRLWVICGVAFVTSHST
jgi:hypothetical protein